MYGGYLMRTKLKYREIVDFNLNSTWDYMSIQMYRRLYIASDVVGLWGEDFILFLCSKKK